MKLCDLFEAVYQTRTELRRQGAADAAIAQATVRIVRDAWEPLVPDVRDWPWWMTRATCAYCDDTGLVIHRNISNRLGILVEEGEPCRCQKGAKFFPKVPDQDHTQAGKTPTPPRGFSRFGR